MHVKDNSRGWKTWEEQFIKLWMGRAPIHPGRQVQNKGRWQVSEIRVKFEFYLGHRPFVSAYDIKIKPTLSELEESVSTCGLGLIKWAYFNSFECSNLFTMDADGGGLKAERLKRTYGKRSRSWFCWYLNNVIHQNGLTFVQRLRNVGSVLQ